MKKTVFVLSIIISFIIIACGATKNAAQQNSLYKNLKILPKDITKQQMDSVMNHFSVSLGRKCNFCHVRDEQNNQWDFASDANKHKLVSREMMRMTQKINDDYFNVADTKGLNATLLVTCYTCHQGKAHPAVQPPVATK